MLFRGQPASRSKSMPAENMIAAPDDQGCAPQGEPPPQDHRCGLAGAERSAGRQTAASRPPVPGGRSGRTIRIVQGTRLFAERIDVDAIVAQLTLPKGDRKPGSLKPLEKLVAHLRSDLEEQNMMAPLFGICDLRLADAHLGSSLVASGKARAGVDDAAPPAMQGRQLLQSFVDTLRLVTDVLA